LIFTQSPLAGAYTIDLEKREDERGFFARTFCTEELQNLGLPGSVSQCSISFSLKRATLRGLHYQGAPHAEDKWVRCTGGAVFDVIVDLRTESPTYAKWWGVELSASNWRTIFVPQGFAHGFVTLSDRTEVYYMMSVPFVADAAAGIRWDDPVVGVEWPVQPEIISSRDSALPLLAEAHGRREL
jgi:dTDP-4-dehydrorhamnose 3,5-epimerase